MAHEIIFMEALHDEDNTARGLVIEPTVERVTIVKTEVGCPQITDLRCPLFTDEIVRLSCSDCGIGHYLLSGRDGSLPQEPGLLLLT